MNQKRWEICSVNQSFRQAIAEELGISYITAQILLNRGITSVEGARLFFATELDNMLSPFLFSGMEKACERLSAALHTGEKVVIFGDYDVDGITGTSLLWRVLREAGGKVDYYIPDRAEGYGLNLEAVKRLAQSGYTLILTVDNGISCLAEVELANSLEIDVIITDHHEPPEVIPDALVVIDPKLPACGYPFASLAGVGVAFKLCLALAARLQSQALEDFVFEQLDLVTLGTVADVVSLTGENRVIVANGLKKIKGTKNLGLQALIKVAQLEEKEISARDIGFLLGPRINAIGRLDNPALGVELLTTSDPLRAAELALQFDQANRKRQMTEEVIIKSAIEMIERDGLDKGFGIVLASADWHHGVIGIAASKIVERFYRPTILIAIDEHGIGKGSARSIRGLNLYEALEHCKENLLGFGGHDMAAGLSIEAERVEAFYRAFNEYVKQALPPEDLLPFLKVDAEVSLNELSTALVGELKRLEPYGQGNPTPILALREVQHEHSLVGANADHLRFQAISGETRVGGIGFGMAGRSKDLRESPKVDVTFNLEINLWQGREYLQMKLIDLKPSELSLIDRLMQSADDLLTRTPILNIEEELKKRENFRRQWSRETQLRQLTETAGQDGVIDVLKRVVQGESALLAATPRRHWARIYREVALYQAFYRKKLTCILYPARLLVAGEHIRLRHAYAPTGMQLYKVAGAVQGDEVKKFFQALENGKADILLATPAYLHYLLERHEGLRNSLGCIIFMEAEESLLHLPAGSNLLRWMREQAISPHMLDAGAEKSKPVSIPRESGSADQISELAERQVPEPGGVQVLGLTAVLDQKMVHASAELLGTRELITAEFSQQAKPEVVDGRLTVEKDEYLVKVAATGEKTLVYVSNPRLSVEVARMLAKKLPNQSGQILYYHERLSAEDQRLVEESFKKSEVRILVSTGAFGCEREVDDIRQVVFYHPSLHHVDFLHRSELVGRDGGETKIHLLYDKGDLDLLGTYLANISPERELLVKVYLFLEKVLRDKGQMVLSNERLAVELEKSEKIVANPSLLQVVLDIMEELNLIALTQNGVNRTITLLPKPKQKLDLFTSIRYNEGIVDKKAFGVFCQVALALKPDEMLKQLQKKSFIIMENGEGSVVG